MNPTDLTLGDVLASHAGALGQRTAAVCGASRWTWAELNDRVDRLAAALSQLGVRRTARVLWAGQNCHRLLEALLASARLGAVLCPVNWRMSVDELEYTIGDADPRVVIWQSAGLEGLTDVVRDRCSRGRRWLQHDGPGVDSEYEALIATTEPLDQPPEVTAGDAATMLYTAAHGGRPNGALMSHRGCISQSVATAALQDIDVEDVVLNFSPMFHVGTLRWTLTAFQVGATNIFTPRFVAEECARLIAAERCTEAFLPPPVVPELLAAAQRDGHDLSSLRAAAGDDDWNAAVTVDERTVRGGWGQTEVGGPALFIGHGGPGVGNAGRPSPLARVEVVDEGGRALVGEVGELVVRGPIVMNGYHNRPTLNAARMRDGWWRTGDLARREPDGTFTFVGPMQRLIRSGGENIYPAEVERCIRAIEGVREVVVVGVPDDRWGQSVMAVVVRVPGNELTSAEVVDRCRDQIASYKKPRGVVFVDELPRTCEGAVDHDQLVGRLT